MVFMSTLLNDWLTGGWEASSQKNSDSECSPFPRREGNGLVDNQQVDIFE